MFPVFFFLGGILATCYCGSRAFHAFTPSVYCGHRVMGDRSSGDGWGCISRDGEAVRSEPFRRVI